MKEKDVASLATLFNQKPEEISSAIENGTVNDLVSSFTSGNRVMPVDDFEKFQKNHREQVITELAEGQQIPKPIYDRVKGTVLEMVERDLSKKYEVDEFKDFDGLIETIVESKTKNPEDVTKYKRQIDELTTQYEDKLKEERETGKRRFINRVLEEEVGRIPIEAEGERLENQRRMLMNQIKTEFGFDLDDTKVKVTEAPVAFQEANLDPKPLSDVLKSYAEKYVDVSPDGGGRGSASSTSQPKKVNLKEYCEANNIHPNTMEHAKAIKEFKDKGIEIE